MGIEEEMDGCGDGRYAEGRDSSDGEWILRGKAFGVVSGLDAVLVGLRTCARRGNG